jgi:cysteine-rich repeat protein
VHFNLYKEHACQSTDSPCTPDNARVAGKKGSSAFSTYVVTVLSSVTGAATGKTTCRLTPAAPGANLTTADIKAMMSTSRSAGQKVLQSLVYDFMAGEGVTTFANTYAAYSVQRAQLSSSLSLGVSGGLGATFVLPSNIQSQLSTGNYDVVVSHYRLVDNVDTAFGLDPVANVWGGLTLSTEKSTTEITVSGLTSPIVIRIPIQQSLVSSREERIWKQKIKCAWYDTKTERTSYDGCNTTLVQTSPLQLTCSCSHLTEFTADIDENAPVCGDGKRSGDTENCDDGNFVNGDGCSESCAQEEGSFCRGVPSVCCIPCPVGTFRSGCESQIVSRGTCVKCSAGTYKNTSNDWATKCDACPYGTYNTGTGFGTTGVADKCNPFVPCAPGRFLSGMNASHPGVCVDCAQDSYKSETGTWETKCIAFATCPAGQFRTGHSRTSPGAAMPKASMACSCLLFFDSQEMRAVLDVPLARYFDDRAHTHLSGSMIAPLTLMVAGTCQSCAKGFYKDSPGTYASQCTACPANSDSPVVCVCICMLEYVCMCTYLSIKTSSEPRVRTEAFWYKQSVLDEMVSIVLECGNVCASVCMYACQ